MFIKTGSYFWTHPSYCHKALFAHRCFQLCMLLLRIKEISQHNRPIYGIVKRSIICTRHSSQTDLGDIIWDQPNERFTCHRNRQPRYQLLIRSDKASCACLDDKSPRLQHNKATSKLLSNTTPRKLRSCSCCSSPGTKADNNYHVF